MHQHQQDQHKLCSGAGFGAGLGWFFQQGFDKLSRNLSSYCREQSKQRNWKISFPSVKLNCYCDCTCSGSFVSENIWRSRENVGSFRGTSCFRNRWVISDRCSVPLKVRSRAATSSSADLREESCQSDSSSLTAEESSALSASSDTPFCRGKKSEFISSHGGNGPV